MNSKKFLINKKIQPTNIKTLTYFLFTSSFSHPNSLTKTSKITLYKNKQSYLPFNLNKNILIFLHLLKNIISTINLSYIQPLYFTIIYFFFNFLKNFIIKKILNFTLKFYIYKNNNIINS